MAPNVTQIDAAVPRFERACIGLSTGAAFVLDAWPLVPVVALILAVGRLGGPRYALFGRIYERWIRPRRAAPVALQPVGPPRFAQALGAAVLSSATVAFIVGLTMPGWVLTLLVTAAATIGALTRVCIACRIYELASR